MKTPEKPEQGQIIEINNKKYTIERQIDNNTFFDDSDYRSKYMYFSAKTNGWPFVATLAYWNEYWGVGENLYNAGTNLEAGIFARNRDKFIKLLAQEPKEK